MQKSRDLIKDKARFYDKVGEKRLGIRMPVSICTRLEKIQREFLWSGGSLAKKTHLVNWKTVCTEKKKGGLGLRRFSILNKALMCKWCCRFANERDSLWRKVIRSKFGEDYGG